MAVPAFRAALLFLAFTSALAQSSVLECLAWGQDGCLELELDKTLRNAESIPVLRLTRHLALVENPSRVEAEEASRKAGEEETTLERLERFLYTHSLKLDLPEELVSGARGLISDTFLSKLPSSLRVPLDGGDVVEGRGRGFMKKVVLPFILGLKFKTTAVIPIAIGLIALKTWKALTLGLLSIVLSAALVIFRLTRPKTINYEVVYPATHGHHVVDEHYHGRAAQDMAFRAYRR